MIIDCEHDPWDLIGEIGDPNFYIRDENYEAYLRHDHHPEVLRITDGGNNGTIDVSGSSVEDTRRMAEALCKLLNQDYYRPGVREK